MAIHRKTQRSIGNYDAKFMGPFSMRQTICIGVGLVPSVFVGYAEFKSVFDMEIIFITVVIIMAIPLFLAFGENITYGMKPEDFAKQYCIFRIMAPKIRRYETKTYDDIMWMQKQKEEMKMQETSKNRTKTSKKKDIGSDEENLDKEKKKAGKPGPSKSKFRIYEHKKNKLYPSYQ